MTEEPRPRPDDLGLTLIAPLRITPYWIVHRATWRDQEVTAGEFAPALFRNAEAQKLGKVRLIPSYTYRGIADAMLDRIQKFRAAHLAKTVQPIFNLAQSDDTDSLWLIHQRVTGKLQYAGGAAPGGIRSFALSAFRLGHSLDRLHRAGLFHLDVHPHNISHDSMTRLCFPGIDMRWLGDADPVVMTRPGFAVPEQRRVHQSAPLDASVDIFAAAASLFQVATGEAPADIADRMVDPKGPRAEIARKMRSTIGTDDLGKVLYDVILAGFDQRPERRLQSAADWVEPLRRFFPDEPASEAAIGATFGMQPTAVPTATGSDASATDAGEVRVTKIRASKPPRRFPALMGWTIAVGTVAATAAAAWVWLAPGLLDSDGAATAPKQASTTTAAKAVYDAAEAAMPAADIAEGNIGGVAYRDYMPDIVAATVPFGSSWTSSLAGDPIGTVNRLGKYRDVSTNECTAPMEVHLRADKNGVLVVKPAGIVWVTEWRKIPATPDDNRPPNGLIDLYIAQTVRPDGGDFVAPGLTQSIREMRFTNKGLTLTYRDPVSGKAENEEYVQCEAG